MDNYIINVVSYKRPNNSTCDLLNKTNLLWRVFVYSFDPYINDYLNNYNDHVYVINDFKEANLSKKRQLTLDLSIEQGYKYCYMLDDDIELIESVDCITKKQELITLEYALNTLYDSIINTNYIALSAGYNIYDKNEVISEYKLICNNSIFNLNIYKDAKSKGITYNEKSKSEDTEFTMDLILNHYKMGRLNNILIHNILQGGTTKDGLFYRFENTNRRIVEGEYICSRYPKYKDAFEYDKNHFKLNTDKLKEMLYEN